MKLNVKNFLSFKADSTFSFILNKDGTHYTAIVGDVASGKSNLLEVIKFLKSIFNQNIKLNSKDVSFMQNDNDVEIEMIFPFDNKEYKYGIVFNQNKIIKEYLYVKLKRKFKLIYDRKDDEIKYSHQKYQLESSKLFLPFYSQININDIDIVNVHKYINNIVYSNPNIFSKEEFRNEIYLNSFKDKEYKKELLKYVKKIDETIKGISIVSKKINENSFFEIEVSHKVSENAVKVLNIEKESVVLKKAVYLFTLLFNNISENRVIFIDDLDVYFAKEATMYLINFFQSKAKENNLLIFCINDSSKLESKIIRKENIYLFEKNNECETEITKVNSIIPHNNFTKKLLSNFNTKIKKTVD